MIRPLFTAPLAAVLLLAACAFVERGAADALEPGRYTFAGQAEGEHRFRNRTERIPVSVSGTARVAFQQIHERQDGCDEYALDPSGRPTSRCVAVRCTEQRRVVQLAVPLHVTRADPARDPRRRLGWLGADVLAPAPQRWPFVARS